jgi:hypothetical protein
MATTKTAKPRRLNDHDIFVRGIFSYPTLVLKFLNYALPSPIKPFIDFSTLRQMPDSHISTKLRLTHSDTIYETQLNRLELPENVRFDPNLPPFRFCFLAEFKSSRPRRPIDFQIEDYVQSIRLLDYNNKRPPSLVLPILIYHGATVWQEKRLHDVFSKYLPETLLDFVAFPKYIIIDLQALTDADIEAAIGLEELRGAFVALKHAHDKEFFQKNLSDILKFVNQSSGSELLAAYLDMLLSYSERRSGLENADFQDIYEHFNPNQNMATVKKTFVDVMKEKMKEEAKITYRDEFHLAIKDEVRDEITALVRDEVTASVRDEVTALVKEEVKAEVVAEIQAAEQRKTIIGLTKTKRFEAQEIADLVGVELAIVLEIQHELDKNG